MKHLLTAALALALTGAAATAVADPPDKKHDSHPAASGGGHGGGPPAGGSHGGPPAGGSHGGSPPPGGSHGGSPPAGGSHGRTPDGGALHPTGTPPPGHGSHDYHPAGGPPPHGGHPGGDSPHGAHPDFGGVFPGGVHGGPPIGGRGFLGDGRDNPRGFGERPGFGFQGHGLRPNDRGRSYYNPGAFQQRYRAQRRFHIYGYAYPGGWYPRTWAYGDILPFGWFTPDYYLDWGDYQLPEPPIGCEWVREGPDAVLVDVWTGQVLSVYSGVFY